MTHNGEGVGDQCRDFVFCNIYNASFKNMEETRPDMFV